MKHIFYVIASALFVFAALSVCGEKVNLDYQSASYKAADGFLHMEVDEIGSGSFDGYFDNKEYNFCSPVLLNEKLPLVVSYAVFLLAFLPIVLLHRKKIMPLARDAIII